MKTVDEGSFIEWLDCDVYPRFEEFKEGKIPQDHLIGFILSVFLQSYRMLMSWQIANPDSYNKKNKSSCQLLWRKFRNDCKMDKAITKVLISRYFPDDKKSVDEFAELYKVCSFNEWLDELETSNRPFFSLVVACYNDGKYEKGKYLDRLLSSLCMQNIHREELEVILSDDCSPVPYDEIIDNYRGRLNIITTKTDYNFAPGNTRQKGVDIATGQWLCFADHDDIYYPGALEAVRNYITETDEKLYLYTPFNGVDNNGNVVRKFEKSSGWCHGKFFNLDNLWNHYDISFIHDLKSHEDIAICTQVSCVLDKMGITPRYLNFVTYAWTDNPQSVSHAKYTVETEDGTRDFLEVFFDDYLHSTGYIYLDFYKSGKIPQEYAFHTCLQVICFAYFYIQRFQFKRKDYWKQNLIYAGKFLNEVKDTFNIKTSVASIYLAIAENDGQMYYQVRELAEVAGKSIPQQGLREWLTSINSAYKKSLES